MWTNGGGKHGVTDKSARLRDTCDCALYFIVLIKRRRIAEVSSRARKCAARGRIVGQREREMINEFYGSTANSANNFLVAKFHRGLPLPLLAVNDCTPRTRMPFVNLSGAAFTTCINKPLSLSLSLSPPPSQLLM